MSEYKMVALKPETYSMLDEFCRTRYGTTSVAYNDAVDELIRGYGDNGQ